MYHVYLIKSQNRLVITEQEMDSNDYHFLMKASGSGFISRADCKTFCIGYIYGAANGKKPINSIEEFK